MANRLGYAPGLSAKQDQPCISGVAWYGHLESMHTTFESGTFMQTASKHLEELDWASWPPDQVGARGTAHWKELLGRGSGCQNDMTMGVVRLRQGESLELHHHAQPETYFTLSGRGTVTIEGEAHCVDAGRMLFIPGNARHQINNVEAEDLMILYAFAISDFSKIQYHF
jgi:quercetin dioxygenase-like cupin family protein